MTDPSDDLTGDDEDTAAAAEIPFSVGDLVWAKTKSYSWWPGHVYDPSLAADDIKQARRQRHSALVAYFGDNGSCAWCEPTQLKPFVDEFHQMVQQKRQKSFLSAVAEAVEEIAKFLAKELDCRCLDLPESREVLDEKNHRPIQLRMPVSNYSPADFLKRLHSVARDVSMGDELESAMLGSWVFAIERVSFSADSFEYCQRLKLAELVDDDPVYARGEDPDTISKELRMSEDKVCQRSKRVSAARCIDSESFDATLLCSSKVPDFDACERVIRRCSVTDESSQDKAVVERSKVKFSAGSKKGEGGIEETTPSLGTDTKLASAGGTSLSLQKNSADHCGRRKRCPVKRPRKRKIASIMETSLVLHQTSADHYEKGTHCPAKTKMKKKKRKVKGHSNGTPSSCSGEGESGRKKMIRDEDCSKEAGESRQMTEYKNASVGGDMAAILITFERDISLPSTDSLISTFSEYGHLVEVETLSMDKIGCARVLFTSSSDAEKAFSSRHEISAFGPAVRNYHLCH